MKILLIEDDQAVADSIVEVLSDHYILDIAYTGKTGTYKAHTRDYDLIIIDFNLPDMSGLDICCTIRSEGIPVPIMFLTGRHHIRDKVKALNAGADDYVVKPFSAKELSARVRALLRRTAAHYTEDVIEVDGLHIDTINRVVKRNDKCITLRRKTFDLLEYLVRNRGHVLTRDMIFEHVWETAGYEKSNTVDVHIKHLRDVIDKPFNKPLIKTIHGLGYAFAPHE